MNFIDINKNIVKEFPYTYGWLIDFEKIIMKDNCDIIIRDTDHYFDSIRVEVSSRLGDHETSWKYYSQIWDHISTHCCKCGSSNGVKTIGEYTLCSTVCRDCAEIMRISGVPIVGPELQLIPGLKHQSNIPMIKCRLKALDGHLFYKYSNDLYFQEGQFRVRNETSGEVVKLAGVYTGLRDWKGERIYTGDIVLAEDPVNRKFWGLIMFGNQWDKSDRDISPQWSGFCLAHGGGNFPSALCWASRIEVVGNVVQENEYAGPIPSDNDYESYSASHKESYKFSDENNLSRVLLTMKRTKWIKRTIICIVAIVGVLAIIMAVCDRMVDHAAKNKLYETVEDVPHRKVGLVLGTSPISTWNGRRNYYFDHRIKAAADLYNAGKVEWLVVSGGDYRNTENGYDEPVAMRDSLMRQGVDSVRIILDYDGTRTLNSIAKMRDVYRQDSIIIISQKYHNERALYQAKHLGIDAIGYNAKTPGRRTSWWRNRGREVLARVKLFIDIARGMQPDIKESMVSDFTESKLDFLSESHIQTEYGDLICLKPDMSRLTMDMICGEIPSADNDSIVLAFAGAYTGSTSGKGHINIAGNHVSGGKIYRGYRCKGNTGAFTWSPTSGPNFFFDEYQSAMIKSSKEGGMGFAQEMMIHNGKAMNTVRKLGNKNVFRALCLDSKGQLALYESQGIVTFGNFIDALLSQGVKEALYTDMGQGWNYCFYRLNADESSPKYLHDQPLPYASNFVVLKVKQ